MVALFAAAHAVAAPVSLLPNLNTRLHLSDSTPWTILLVLTLITLFPAILLVHDADAAASGGLPLSASGSRNPDSALHPTLMGLALMMTWYLMLPGSQSG